MFQMIVLLSVVRVRAEEADTGTMFSTLETWTNMYYNLQHSIHTLRIHPQHCTTHNQIKRQPSALLISRNGGRESVYIPSVHLILMTASKPILLVKYRLSERKEWKTVSNTRDQSQKY